MTTIISEYANELLLNENLSDDRVHRLLKPIGFADPLAAYRRLRKIAKTRENRLMLADNLSYLVLALSDAANPDNVLVNFSRFAHSYPDQLKLFHQIRNNPRLIEIMVKLFAASQFLTEILLRDPKYFDKFTNLNALTQPKTAQHHRPR